MTFTIRVYDVLNPRGIPGTLEARSNAEAASLAHAEYRRRASEVRQRAGRERAWTRREQLQRQRFVLGELAFLYISVEGHS